MGVFDGVKRSLVSPVDANVEVPVIEKKNGQIIAVVDNNLQIMDLETFETFETSSMDEEIKDKVRQGADVEYWKVLGRTKIVRIKS